MVLSLSGLAIRRGRAPRRPAVTALVLAVLVGSASACGGGAGAAPQEPRLTTVAQVARESQIVLPADAYVLDGRQRLLLARAQHVLVRRCVERVGERYTEPEQAADAYLSINNDRRFGLFDLQVARRLGFHAPDTADPEADRRRDAWQPSVGEREALRGSATDPRIPAGGCYGEAARALQPREGVQEPTTELHSLYEQAITDSRTEQAFADWSACMRQRGFDYADPPTLFSVPWSRSVTRHERSTAIAHVRCAVSTNLVGRWIAVLGAYQEREIRAHREFFDQLRDANAELVARARSILDGQGG